jgi:DnaJ-domain-containing protein 1
MSDFDITKYTGKSSDAKSDSFDISKYTKPTTDSQNQVQVTGDPRVDELIRSGFLTKKQPVATKPYEFGAVTKEVLGPSLEEIKSGLKTRGLEGLKQTGSGLLGLLNAPAAAISELTPKYLVTQGGAMPEDVARRKMAADLSMMQQVAIPELAETGPAALAAKEIKASQVPIVTDKPAALKRIQKEVGPATSTSAVGEKIENNLLSRLQDLIKSRTSQFEGVKNAYFKAGKEQGPQLVEDYKNLLKDEYVKAATEGSQDEISLIAKLNRRVSDRPVSLTDREAGTISPDFNVLEKERRFLNDIANGLEVEGAEGITANFARDMAAKLEGVISNKISKEFNAFKDTYTALSEPINEYARATGAKVTQRADEYLPNVSKVDPAQLPDTFFKSRRSVQDLRALAADETFVRQVAKEHVSTELRNATSAKEIRDYMTKNYDWLQEFPEIKSDLEKIASGQRGKEITRSIAKIGGTGIAGALGLKAVYSGAGTLANLFGGY